MATKEKAKKDVVNGDDSTSESLVDKKASTEDLERETWDKKADFMLSCIGYAVGLGNIWRFPYLCYRNGGGAFLVPYFTFLIICGIPLFFLELSFGQFGALGPIAIWKIAPLFKGVGYCMLLISFVVCIYYNVIIAYSVHFIFSSLKSVLPWSTCGNYWNSDFCQDAARSMVVAQPPTGSGLENCKLGESWFASTGTTFVNSTWYLNNVTYADRADWENGTEIIGSCIKFNTSAQEYFNKRVLRLTDSISDTGNMQWELVGCLLFSWIVVFLCQFKGVKWSGKIVYFTATFPYVVLLILLVRGLTLNGASEGISYYLTPNVTKLRDVRVWSDAAVQIFYSLGAAWGVLLSYSSLNKFNNNVYRDAITICCVNCCTSLLSGFVVFSVLGSLAYQTGRNVSDVVDQGAGLAFVAYPAAVANLPIAPLWAFLFFFMLFNLGLDSQFGMIEAVVNGMLDEVKWLRKNRIKFLAAICVIQFLCGIPMVTESGMYWVTLVDWYASGFPLMFAAALEICCISWNYGVKRFLYDIECMIGHRPFLWQWWQIAWVFVTPLCTLMLIVAYVAFYSPVTYNGQRYPGWAEAIGWLSAFLSILSIPGIAIFQLIRHPRAKGYLLQRVKALMRCDDDWGPRDLSIPYRYRINKVRCVEMTEVKNPEEGLACCKRTESSSSSCEEYDPPPTYE